MIHYQQSWSFRTSTLLVMVITVTSHYLSLWFNFNFDSSQITCVGSSLHGDDFTTRFSSTTWLWTITYKADIVISIAPLSLPSLSTYRYWYWYWYWYSKLQFRRDVTSRLLYSNNPYWYIPGSDDYILFFTYSLQWFVSTW